MIIFSTMKQLSIFLTLAFSAFCVQAESFDYCKYMKFVDCSIRQDPFDMCGSNGVTYPSKCEFIVAHCKDSSIGLVHSGECAVVATVPPTDEFCQNLLKQNCHGARHICGTNGVDYGNDCEFEKAKCWDPKLHIKHVGKC